MRPEEISIPTVSWIWTVCLHKIATQMSRAPKSPEGHQIYLEQPIEHRGLDYRSQMASSNLLCLHTLHTRTYLMSHIPPPVLAKREDG